MDAHTIKFFASDRLGTCRFCGESIDPTSKDIRMHKVAEYRFEPWSEAVHASCDDAMPAAGNVPDGYRRYKCTVLSPSKLIVQYDIGSSDIGALLIYDYKALNMKLSVIRNARCIYFQNMLQVDIPIDIANKLIYAEASVE